MKKTIFVAIALLAMSLYSCDSTGKQSDNQPSGDNAATTEQVEGNTGNTATAVAVPEGLTGDMEKDADLLVSASIEQSMNMINGQENADEKARVNKMMKDAKEYYGSQGKSEEFAKIVGTKMASGISEIAAKMKKK